MAWKAEVALAIPSSEVLGPAEESRLRVGKFGEFHLFFISFVTSHRRPLTLLPLPYAPSFRKCVEAENEQQYSETTHQLEAY